MPVTLPVLIMQTGAPDADLAARHGGYSEQIREAAGLRPDETHIVAVHRGESLPPPTHYRAALITGSPAMVTDLEPWSESAAAWLRGAAAAGLPMFGICYGHQLLAHALGGEVGYNPAGRELGTQVIELLADDPLLEGLPACFPAQMLHAQTVLRPPAGTVVLARSAQDAHQLLRLAPGIYSSQFHPEFGPTFVRDHLRAHVSLYAREGLDGNALADAVIATPLAARVLPRFLSLCARAEAVAA